MVAFVVVSGLSAVARAGQTPTEPVQGRMPRTSLEEIAGMPSPDGMPATAGLPGTLSLPEAPMPQSPSSSPTPKANPCPQRTNAANYWRRADPRAAIAGARGEGVHPAIVPCQRRPLNEYQRFMNGPKATELAPKDKAWLAARNVVDPFNLITIGGDAAISVALDSHSAYGPGMKGLERYAGVSLTEDITGEFFGTFLIPSLVHQDPHYHRMEGRPIPRRTAHAITQVIWSQSDTGRGMPNYANLVGFAIEDEIGNLYVPGRETNGSATVTRYGIGLASAPIGNLINEFLPDVASHVHVQIVVLQRIINRFARTATAGSTTEQAGVEGDTVEWAGW